MRFDFLAGAFTLIDSLLADPREPHRDRGDKSGDAQRFSRRPGNSPAASALARSGSEDGMPLNNGPGGSLGLLLGGIVAIMLAIFLIAGGELGKKKVQGDQDMPPVSSPEKTFR
jgi:hypothetical protein